MPVTIDELTVADEPEPWAAIGFTLYGRTCIIGDVRIHLAGANTEGRGPVRIIRETFLLQRGKRVFA